MLPFMFKCCRSPLTLVVRKEREVRAGRLVVTEVTPGLPARQSSHPRPGPSSDSKSPLTRWSRTDAPRSGEHAHRLQVLVETLLHGFEHVFVFPSCDPAFRTVFRVVRVCCSLRGRRAYELLPPSISAFCS